MINSLVCAVLAAVSVPFMTEHRNMKPSVSVTTNFYGSVTGVVDHAYVLSHGAVSTSGVTNIVTNVVNKAYMTDAIDSEYIGKNYGNVLHANLSGSSYVLSEGWERSLNVITNGSPAFCKVGNLNWTRLEYWYQSVYEGSPCYVGQFFGLQSGADNAASVQVIVLPNVGTGVGVSNFLYQQKLTSGTNIKTINNQSLLGSGNIEIQGGGSINYVVVTNIAGTVVSNVVTKSFVEGLGVVGSDTNTVNGLIQQYDITNLTARINAKRGITDLSVYGNVWNFAPFEAVSDSYLYNIYTEGGTNYVSAMSKVGAYFFLVCKLSDIESSAHGRGYIVSEVLNTQYSSCAGATIFKTAIGVTSDTLAKFSEITNLAHSITSSITNTITNLVTGVNVLHFSGIPTTTFEESMETLLKYIETGKPLFCNYNNLWARYESITPVSDYSGYITFVCNNQGYDIGGAASPLVIKCFLDLQNLTNYVSVGTCYLLKDDFASMTNSVNFTNAVITTAVPVMASPNVTNEGAKAWANATFVKSVTTNGVSVPVVSGVVNLSIPQIGADMNAVHYTTDSNKTDAEKAQARTNIGAPKAQYAEKYADEYYYGGDWFEKIYLKIYRYDEAHLGRKLFAYWITNWGTKWTLIVDGENIVENPYGNGKFTAEYYNIGTEELYLSSDYQILDTAEIEFQNVYLSVDDTVELLGSDRVEISGNLTTASKITNAVINVANTMFRTRTDNVCHSDSMGDFVCTPPVHNAPGYEYHGETYMVKEVYNNVYYTYWLATIPHPNAGIDNVISQTKLDTVVFDIGVTARRSRCATSGKPFVTCDNIPSTNGFVTAQAAADIAGSESVTNNGAVARSKSYADATFLPLSGGSMTGPISMDYNSVNLYINGYGLHFTGTNDNYLAFAGAVNTFENDFIFVSRDAASEVSIYSRLMPDGTPVATSNMVERVIASKPAPSPLTGKTYDFANGSNFTYRLYVTLTNVIQTLGGTVTNTPNFN